MRWQLRHAGEQNLHHRAVAATFRRLSFLFGAFSIAGHRSPTPAIQSRFGATSLTVLANRGIDMLVLLILPGRGQRRLTLARFRLRRVSSAFGLAEALSVATRTMSNIVVGRMHVSRRRVATLSRPLSTTGGRARGAAGRVL